MLTEALKKRGVREVRQDEIVLHKLLHNKHTQTSSFAKVPVLPEILAWTAIKMTIALATHVQNLSGCMALFTSLHWGLHL
jgi:hypothetical protein